ncbi:MAG TPA: DUF447 domain-containing protein [Pirellulales bacterium]|nr:DUF447 domain-containing protein [Pirellulales bacterium]
MILEGIVTTTNDDGSVHIAPMGPIVDEGISRLRLRPYQTSTTLKNLVRSRQGVFHVTDDVELLARAAVGRLETLPRLIPGSRRDIWVLADACRWFAFEVREIDLSEPRACLIAEVVERGVLRDFLGFNRAKHAVVEAAILATRVNFLPAETITAEMRRLAVLVEKTAGPAEDRAFAFLEDFLRHALDDQRENAADPEFHPSRPGASSAP